MKERFSWLNNDRSSKLLRYIGYSVSFVMLFIFAFFIFGQYFTSEKILLDGKAVNFDEGWYFVDEDGSSYEIVLPESIPCADNKQIEIRKALPNEIVEESYLCILNRWDMDVYIGGELRYSSEDDADEIPGGYVKSHFVLVPVEICDAGKQISIQRDVTELVNADFNSVFFGSKTGIFYLLMERFGPQMMAAIALFAISLMIMLVGYILLIVYRRKMPIILLTYAMMLTAAWFVFDSFLYQILFDNYYVDGPMEYMLIMVAPFFFMRYLNYEQERRYETCYSVLGILMVINFLATTSMHFFGIRAYENNISFTGLNALVSFLAYFITMGIDLKKGLIKRYVLVAIGFVMIVFFGVIQAVVLYAIVDNHDALFLLMGMYSLLLFAVIHMIMKLRQLEDASRWQKHANELKSNFLANMSHEIRTPVNAILGMNEMIFRESSENEIKEYAANVKSAGTILLDIINDILDFSKIESGKMTLVEEKYDLSEVISNLENIIGIRAKDKELDFSVSVNPDIPKFYIGDENRIQQVLINILNNAVKYTKEGAVSFAIDIDKNKTDSSQDASIVTLCFSVKDTGIGIKKEDMGSLFATFERIDLKKNRSIEGTGLGLSITNNLVKLMNGSIGVESEYGVGSTFCVSIPQKVLSEERIGKLDEFSRFESIISLGKDDNFTAPNARILVVDDMKINVRVVEGLLKPHQLLIDSALSGKECLDMYEDGKYDLILLDHMMPEMDGIETLRLLKEKAKCICPVVVLTANAISGIRDMYINEGFSDYLSKPTKPEELDKMILKYIPKDKIEIQHSSK